MEIFISILLKPEIVPVTFQYTVYLIVKQNLPLYSYRYIRNYRINLHISKKKNIIFLKLFKNI